jgi:hypothetical protein
MALATLRLVRANPLLSSLLRTPYGVAELCLEYQNPPVSTYLEEGEHLQKR